MDEDQRIALSTGATMDLRKYAIEKALNSVKVFDILDVDNGEEYGDLIVAIADKIENYILEGKKEDDK